MHEHIASGDKIGKISAFLKTVVYLCLIVASVKYALVIPASVKTAGDNQTSIMWSEMPTFTY